jgi:integrase
MMETTARDLPSTDKGLATYLRNIKAPEKREWLALGDGLAICLEPSGMKTFQARIRRQGDKAARRIRIGSFPAVTLVQARAKLAEMKSVAREGRDPALAQRRARATVETPRTVADLVGAYLDRREGGIAAKTIKIERELLGGVLVGSGSSKALGARLLVDLEPIDVGRVVGEYAARLRREGRSNGTNANKLLAATRRMFKLARGWALYAGPDPTSGLVKPAKELPKDRILFDGTLLVAPEPRLNEIGRLVEALKDPNADPDSAATRAALMLTLRLGLRAAEVCSLEWRIVDLGEAPSLAVTRSKTKAGLRTLPLPKAAADELRALRAKAKGPWVFPARRDAKRAYHLHPESLSRAFARLCDRLRKSEDGLAVEGVGLDNVSTHDLRRTAISGLIELGHEGVARRIAGHAATDVTGRHYDRSHRVEAMRAGLEGWSAAIDAAARRARTASEMRK